MDIENKMYIGGESIMFFFTLQSTDVDPKYSEAGLRALREMILAQLEDMKLLCTIVEYLKGYEQVGLDRTDARKYTDKIQLMTDRQHHRFHEIDQLINQNIKDIKKQKTTDESVFRFGREVRKLEAGLRTIKLFASDVIEMLKVDNQKMNRVNERIRYFEGRSASLEAEMQLLLNDIK